MADVYMAARYSRREELCIYKKELESRGHDVPARWLLGEHQAHGLEAARAVEGAGPIPADQAILFAQDDVEDILQSDTMIVFTEAPYSVATRGGKHVETGIYLGLKMTATPFDYPRHLYLVGPLENVFGCLPEVDGRFSCFADLLEAIDTGAVKM